MTLSINGTWVTLASILGYIAILGLRSRTFSKKLCLPAELDGLGISPDGSVVLAVDGEKPNLYVIKTADDTLHSTVQLEHHRKAAQIVRYSPDGRFIVVTSHDEAVGTILSGDLSGQRKIRLEKVPMDMAFHPVINLETAEILQTFKAGKGVETLSFF